jgi:hypothetical protein
MKNKWKQKMIEKQNEKKMKLQMNTQMKNKWKKISLNISMLWLDANHITLIRKDVKVWKSSGKTEGK